MKYLEDVAYVVLLVTLMPLWILLVWAALITMLARRMFWSMRGHATNLTRRRARRRRPLAELWSRLRGRLPPAMPEAAPDLFPAAALHQAQGDAAPRAVV